MVKNLVIIKSHFLAFPLSWRWRLLNLRSSHDPITGDHPSAPWLEQDGPAHKALHEIVMDRKILAKAEYITSFQ